MASGFFALLDDIAALMDDVAAVSKIATKKTAGILGDDLAVNADKASGFDSSREIPVLLKIMKGSFINKLIILPFAFVLSAYLPVAVTVILVLGAIFLAFEGVEKIYEFVIPHKHEVHQENASLNLTEEETLEIEKEKIKSAIVTDFILSVEIVIIALGSVMNETLLKQILAVSFVAILATVGVYGIVALIVRMDDLGFKMMKSRSEKSIMHKIGKLLVNALPIVIKALAVAGTIALLLVSGEIFVHKIAFIHHLVEALPALLANLLAGLVVGFVAVLVYLGVKRLLPKK